jgi:hypothetical protein
VPGFLYRGGAAWNICGGVSQEEPTAGNVLPVPNCYGTHLFDDDMQGRSVYLAAGQDKLIIATRDLEKLSRL